MEVFGRLVVAFREYRHAVRDHKSTEFAERNAIFYAGWLGHYVADGSNPLHTTVNYNGWTTANPNGYTTEKTIHWKMEGEFVAANQKRLQFAALVPDQPTKLDHPFQDYLAYLRKSHGYVEQVYQLEKAGGFAARAAPSRDSSSSSAWPPERRCCGTFGTPHGSTARWILRPTCRRSPPARLPT